MPIRYPSTKLLGKLMSQCEERLIHYGCTQVDDFRLPKPHHTVRNEIHPIFKSDRWLAGREQLTPTIYERMSAPLRLASRFLQEDCVLDHFVHFQLGKHKISPEGKAYIVKQTTPYSDAQRSHVKRQFRKLAEIITCCFCPSSCVEEVVKMTKGGENMYSFYGVSFIRREQTPLFKRYPQHKWPLVNSKPPDLQSPIIMLNADYADFLSSPTYDETNLSCWYRTMFRFAGTLVHEVAHIFNWFVNGNAEEVCWSNCDSKAELGYAWERAMFGMQLLPLFNNTNNCSLIASMSELKTYLRANQARKAIAAVAGHDNPHYVELHRVADDAPWEEMLPTEDLWTPSYSDGRYKRCVAAFHAIPMKWITDWFVEEMWERRRRRWERTGVYEPPPLGKTFHLLYKHDHEGAGVWYPLDSAFPQDRDVIRRQQEWMATNSLAWRN